MLAKEITTKARKSWVTGSNPEQLEFYAKIIQLRIADKLTYEQIAKMMKTDKGYVSKVVKKYYPKVGKYDITMTIMSKV